MSDLATVLDLQGKHDEALAHVKRAVELAQASGHPDQHVLLGNMAGILMHKGSTPLFIYSYVTLDVSIVNKGCTDVSFLIVCLVFLVIRGV